MTQFRVLEFLCLRSKGTTAGQVSSHLNCPYDDATFYLELLLHDGHIYERNGFHFAGRDPDAQ